MTDETLVKEAAGGNEAAFLLLYERHRRAVYQVAYRLTGSREAAEDVTHDCFMSLIRRTDRFDPTRAPLRIYLLAISRNLAVSQHRWSSARVELTAIDEHDPPTTDADPHTRLIARERAARVRQAIGALPVLQREVVVLVEYEELTLAEASAVVGANVGAVSSRLFRARAALRRMLSATLAIEPPISTGTHDE